MSVLLTPAILFFIVGLISGFLKNNLTIPEAITKFLSIYLLISIGLKGGVAISVAGFSSVLIAPILLGIFLSIFIPIVTYIVLKPYLNLNDLCAVAATYGSVSAVTFITATQLLISLDIAFGGYMTAVMAIMELPAILIALYLANKNNNNILKETIFDGASFLLLSSLIIGIIIGVDGYALVSPFTVDLFPGLLSLFLLDIGIKIANNFEKVKEQNYIILMFSILAPLINAIVALLLAFIFGLSLGNGFLLMVLAASASYIAVPAVMKHAIPEANPSIYLGMSLGLTFPFNILLGLPIYYWLATLLLL